MAPVHPQATSVAVYPALFISDMQLYERLSVRWSVGPSQVNDLKSGKMSDLDPFYACLSVGGGLGCRRGLDATTHPSATIL